MMDSLGNIKVSGDCHPKRRQVCSLHHKEEETKHLSSKYSDTSAKLQDLSVVLDDRTLLAEMYINHGSNKKLRKTTKGWHLCVEWKDVTTSWERLADLKESNPFEVAEYAATKILLNTPYFVWWAPYVLQKRTIIIAAVTKRYHKRTHKFGIEVPKSWDDCVKLDKENYNTLCQDAVRKEMKNGRIAFKILNGEESDPPTYQEIRCHMIFDVKMEDFRRNARFVGGGHTTDTALCTLLRLSKS
jgi:hypothetical protein